MFRPVNSGWIGVDLDGTLARYDGWFSHTHIGAPVLPMVRRVQDWLRYGYEVRIVTARVSIAEYRDEAAEAIQKWCVEHIGVALRVTHEKDFDLIELWDDRAVGVRTNTGSIETGGVPRVDCTCGAAERPSRTEK